MALLSGNAVQGQTDSQMWINKRVCVENTEHFYQSIVCNISTAKQYFEKYANFSTIAKTELNIYLLGKQIKEGIYLCNTSMDKWFNHLKYNKVWKT